MPREEREPLRLQLAPTWLDIEAHEDAPAPAASCAPVVAQRIALRRSCRRCGGDLTRSRVLAFEHPLTWLTRRRPFRCVVCRSRRWR
jgi:hypothetical protein